MSYRDLRNFTEMMRGLGYPRLISMENFRNPNFPLVAEVLVWLVKRYDPNAFIHMEIDTEQDRVMFIKTIAEFMNMKAHIKLSTKKLYQSDGYAVKELLKVTSTLYGAMKHNTLGQSEGNDSDNMSPAMFDISSKLNELKETRKLASVITSRGAALYDYLGKEVDLREQRLTVLGRQLEINDVEKGLANSVIAVETDIKKTVHMLDNVASDEANLEAKIDKKKGELERNQKRLETLQTVRPAYMDEYEKLEEDLQKLYDVYMNKFRNLAYLEQQLDEHNKLENDKIEVAEKELADMAERLKSEEEKHRKLVLDDEKMVDSDILSDGNDSEPDEGLGKRQRPTHHRTRPEPAPRPLEKPKMQGNMMPDEISEDSDEESGDSDIDIDDEEHDDEEDIDSDEIEVDQSRPGRRQQPQPGLEDSDNDF